MGIEVLRPQDILAMWIRFSGCAHKYTLTHIRGRDHREWGQGGVDLGVATVTETCIVFPWTEAKTTLLDLI